MQLIKTIQEWSNHHYHVLEKWLQILWAGRHHTRLASRNQPN